MSAPARAALPSSRPYYPALTGLRAIAAYLVFFLHYRPAVSEWLQSIFSQFYVGVGIFFVISGFVIATRYQARVQLRAAWWRRYFWRRVARILPVYLLLNGLLLAYVYWPIPPGNAANSLLLVLLSQTLLRGFSSTLKYVGIPQGWSLTVEECFYFSVPFLLLAWRRWGHRGAAGFVAVVLATGLFLTCLCQDHAALHGFFGSYYHLFNYTFFGRVFEFTLGVGLARWWAARPAPESFRFRWPWRTLAGTFLMGLTVWLLAWLRSPANFYDGRLHPGAIALNNVVFPVGVVLLLAGLLAERSWLRDALATKLMQALGRSSYFFYLFHIGLFSIWWQNRFGPNAHPGWRFLATVVLSEIGYRALEEPLRRWVLARTLDEGKPE
ncbi:MAG TPA: acyltransferase [Hymenobacter sp.]|jgi:peptidoglycan/LPS O-acetylase OafA/YrhL